MDGRKTAVCVGAAGQTCLQQASVLVIGAGGLGCPAILYLAAAGIGRLGVVDRSAPSIIYGLGLLCCTHFHLAACAACMLVLHTAMPCHDAQTIRCAMLHAAAGKSAGMPWS